MGLAAYLFYDTWIAIIPLIPLLCVYMRMWEEQQCRRKEEIFREQFGISIQTMASALKVGYSVENAVRETSKEMKTLLKKESRICREFERMVHQLEINQPVEKVMSMLSVRVKQEDVSSFVIVFNAAKRAGGDSIEILQSAAREIGEKIEAEKEIQTLLAAKKLEFKMMCVIPFGILLYMRLSFSEFMQVLYGNPVGVTLMTVCLGVYIAAYQMGKKLVEIEV